jgi:hypothetical protein
LSLQAGRRPPETESSGEHEGEPPRRGDFRGSLSDTGSSSARATPTVPPFPTHLTQLALRRPEVLA